MCKLYFFDHVCNYFTRSCYSAVAVKTNIYRQHEVCNFVHIFATRFGSFRARRLERRENGPGNAKSIVARTCLWSNRIILHYFSSSYLPHPLYFSSQAPCYLLHWIQGYRPLPHPLYFSSQAPCYLLHWIQGYRPVQCYCFHLGLLTMW